MGQYSELEVSYCSSHNLVIYVVTFMPVICRRLRWVGHVT